MKQHFGENTEGVLQTSSSIAKEQSEKDVSPKQKPGLIVMREASHKVSSENSKAKTQKDKVQCM